MPKIRGIKGFLNGSVVKKKICLPGFEILGLGRSPGIGKGNPLQCSCLENSMDTGACQTAVCGVAESM